MLSVRMGLYTEHEDIVERPSVYQFHRCLVMRYKPLYKIGIHTSRGYKRAAADKIRFFTKQMTKSVAPIINDADDGSGTVSESSLIFCTENSTSVPVISATVSKLRDGSIPNKEKFIINWSPIFRKFKSRKVACRSMS